MNAVSPQTPCQIRARAHSVLTGGASRHYDRFITSASSTSTPRFLLSPSAADNVADLPAPQSDGIRAYETLLQTEVLEYQANISPLHASPDNVPIAPRILACQSPPRVAAPSAFAVSPCSPHGLRTVLFPPKSRRILSHSSFKVLDGPALEDDFYLNVVDWSAQNVVGVGLGSAVYLWSPMSNHVTKICDVEDDVDLVTSVHFDPSGVHMAVGTRGGLVHIWDVQRSKRLRTLGGHSARVGSLAWSPALLSSGSRDSSILQRDLRVPRMYTDKLAAHKLEVCGLKWSPDFASLASGSNDNTVMVWDHAKFDAATFCFTAHTAAVKALAWSPHQRGLLASGGGSSDQSIRFWDALHTGKQLAHLYSGSQVCNVAWSKSVNELVSTHGFSQNQVAVWRYPSLEQVGMLLGHSSRVLYMALSPDGETVVTGAGDETLRFWNVFPPTKAVSRVTSSILQTSILRFNFFLKFGGY